MNIYINDKIFYKRCQEHVFFIKVSSNNALYKMLSAASYHKFLNKWAI